MNKEIIKYPSPVLRKKSQEVEKVTEETKRLGWDMIETMEERKGIGLAGPQVGELKRVITVQLEKPLIFINPKILKKTKETEAREEGCLSFPGLFLKIKRHKGVEIEALNEKGEKINFEAVGLPARILQHEIDHLNGILFIDRTGFWQRLKIRNKLRQILKPPS
ncbi:MAG: peptide deformylase [Candidatus Nealsonbacteria bacterium CG_4_8_14_3_um_filter_40_11]|uniref:Peptide deformylase n=3 Tax=Candidatus Nealsoniibacteriota TaxID=1817911 RepID=A0A2M7IJM0_9BACT|nr:MAG: peptide deformylase [Candidatus Nealsonbacteria bacterium CG_4_8_14_3_um_filter_40_11]